MSLFKQWQELAESVDQSSLEAFTQTYYVPEEELYKSILKEAPAVKTGTFQELAQAYGFTLPTFAGFMDGIQESLKQPLDVETLTETSEIVLDVDFEKLYYNMLEAKADWLYNLEEWDAVLPKARRTEIARERNRSKQAVSAKIDRNGPCPCGSGKKYKKCCGAVK